MQLGTFGAILRFALQIEEEAAAFYAAAEGPPFEQLARQAERRRERLERARREGVQEMILEAISGLDDAAYALPAGGAAAGRLEQALALEERAGRFYRAAAERMPIRGVARLFRRLAQEHADQIVLLQSIEQVGGTDAQP